MNRNERREASRIKYGHTLEARKKSIESLGLLGYKGIAYGGEKKIVEILGGRHKGSKGFLFRIHPGTLLFEIVVDGKLIKNVPPENVRIISPVVELVDTELQKLFPKCG